MRPLVGRRVVVTRAAEQADALADILRERGALPVVVPLVEIVPRPGELAALAALRPTDFDWLVVTSPNAAQALADVHPAEAAPTVTESAATDAAGHRCPLVAAVGTATATELAAAGRQVALVPARQRAAALVEAFPAGPGRVLVVQGEQAATVLTDGLAAKGWTVTVVRPYDSVARRPTAAERAGALAADAVVFASGSAARAWVDAFGPLAPPVVVAIGPQTAAATERAGLKVSSTAADHSLVGLVAALERCCEELPGTPPVA